MTVFSRTLLVALLFTASAHAQTLEVGVHPDSVTVKGTAGLKTIPLPFPPGGNRSSESHTIAIGDGKKVAHVRVSVGTETWEAIVAGGANDPIWAGKTGFTAGEDGERTGNIVLITDRDEVTKFVLIGDIREDTRICGQQVTPLAVRGLDPRTMQLRGATLHRIEKKERDAATPIVAMPVKPGDPSGSLARLLHATGGSSGGAAAVTDETPDSSWSENRPGDGHGEFVTMAAPPEVPLKSLILTPAHDRAAPRTFFIATDTKLFQVTMPEDATLKPGTTYEIPFAEPVKTACVALVLDEAYAHGNAPVVGVAELSARGAFDAEGATQADLVKALSGARADEAAAMLRRGGSGALDEVIKQWPTLDAKARAYAIDVVASTGTCSGPTMALLAKALPDADREVRRRALGRVERCGRNAAPALATAVQMSIAEPEVAAAATMLASVSPSQAFEPILGRLGYGSAETRHTLRAALTKAAAATPSEKLAAAVTAERAPAARLELLRALGPKLTEVKPQAEAALASVLAGTPDMATRYLALEPMAALGDTPHLAQLATSSAEWPIRARAIELAAANAPAAAASDPEPRVREAAVRATGVNASELLAHDPWTFVRVAAAESLGTSARDNGALAKALGDHSARVRAAAVRALGKAHATTEGAKVYARLDDTKEDTEVRALAARALGEICMQSAADRLTKLALLAQHPVDEADERLGMAALEGLGHLHPADLEKRLAPLRAKESRTLLRRAADAALAAEGSCH